MYAHVCTHGTHLFLSQQLLGLSKPALGLPQLQRQPLGAEGTGGGPVPQAGALPVQLVQPGKERALLELQGLKQMERKKKKFREFQKNRHTLPINTHDCVCPPERSFGRTHISMFSSKQLSIQRCRKLKFTVHVRTSPVCFMSVHATINHM